MNQKNIQFSIIMPTYNRAFCIETAINSLLSQTYQNFELVIVDDGSTDGTENLLKEKFSKELANERIKYISVKPNKGVCNARNVGLENAKNEWIGYLDTDNTIDSKYLEEFKNAIIENPNRKIFYAKLITGHGNIIGKSFDYKALCEGNYIDMGAFVHHKSLVNDLGKFDTSLKRLVDWELIIRYTKKYKPVFINKILLNYSDSKDYVRITGSENLEEARQYIYKKHKIIRKKHKILKLSFSQKIFSVTNQTEGSKCRKIITFLGFKLKLRNKKKEAKLAQEAFNKRNLQTQRAIIEKLTIFEAELDDYKKINNAVINNVLNECYKIQKEEKNILALENENLYAHIFNNLINNTEWIELKDFIPTGGAANYSLLFMILVTLNYAKPRNILELGIGQSSKLTCAYAKFNQENAKLQIIEHDQAWINTMFEQLKPSENINIIRKDMVKVFYNNTENDIYEDLSDVIKDMKYDFVLIDGPYGYNSVYPRMNILDLIPNNLASDFVIILDDAEREGERNTAQLIFNKLNDAGIKYSYKFRGALKTQLVITSKSREFINLY